ncbi:TIGR02270 family protein [Paraburkholderia flagellata]|uniref:TIGR02270 family protein n=1 Tax=Paraburkholderia flagellata TaxID=2883241 RepID=UPI001F28C9FA|nr:TIGR02270 family protein [Paraburkholderia flagellata]
MLVREPDGLPKTGEFQQWSRTPILTVVAQHVEDAASLRNTRSYLVRAPHVRLKHLGRLDSRIAAHLDGIAVAGDTGTRLSLAALERPGRGEVFAACVGYIERRSFEGLDKLMALAEAMPEIEPGLHSAFGWVSAASLRDVVKTQLDRNTSAAQHAGLAACALHRVDPGKFLEAALTAPAPTVRARALRCGGEIGRRDVLPQCLAHLEDEDEACRFYAAYGALLLGKPAKALEFMVDVALRPGRRRAEAIALAIVAGGPRVANDILEHLVSQGSDQRTIVHAVAHTGEVRYISWLIQLMADNKIGRLAGEAFSWITGADLASLDLETLPPEHRETDANGDPTDPGVDMDEDEGAPWPAPEKVAAWWSANASHYRPDQRYFVGAPPSRGHCEFVLKEGYQRQRVVAAHYLCFMEPGRVLFNCAAPAWRQLRYLAS